MVGAPKKDIEEKKQMHIDVIPLHKAFLRKAATMRGIPMTTFIIDSAVAKAERILGKKFVEFHKEETEKKEILSPFNEE